MPIPASAEALFSLVPSRFVVERDTLARTLAARKDPAAADVRRLHRPVGLAWVMNRLARERPREVQALLAAGDRLRVAQRGAIAGRGGDELRAAEGALRSSARQLRLAAAPVIADRGRPAAPGELARIELLLRVAATAPGPIREAFRRGVLEREPEVAPSDLSGFAVVAGGERAAGRRAVERPASPRAAGDRGRERGAAAAGSGAARAARTERERVERERVERERARDEKAEAERAQRERAKRIAVARRELARAEARAARVAREAAVADARAREAREGAEAARAEAERRRASLADLER